MRQNAFAHIRFHGTFRAYQSEILTRAESYLDDEKIHIVAAPGSGKTILGLELIRRIGAPALVLAPTITVRDQWGDRFGEFFLEEGEETPDYVSYSLASPGLLTVITYQALYAAMKKLRFDEELAEKQDADSAHENPGLFDEDLPDAGQPESLVETDSFLRSGAAASYIESGPADSIAVSDPAGGEEDIYIPDLMEVLRRAGIGTICLDEAHHLRREWWVTLQEFMKRVGKSMRTISLTATPPYDSSPLEWARYISVCGEIDDEITVPELVREGVLCPHQDYLLLNRPNVPEEQKMLLKLGNILKIVHTEWASLKGHLRMVILTDYIRKEVLKAVGTDEEIGTMGAVPVFEMVRRSFASGEEDEPGAVVLTGSLLICRTDLIPELEARIDRTLGGQTLRDTGYTAVTGFGQAGLLVGAVTSLFEEGRIPVLIGTKSLLGEGWDAPSVNSLVLASFVGSFVSSNQMRGRAIRTSRSDPGKVSNIWHLTSADGPSSVLDPEGRSEMETMHFRFRCFMGPSYDGRTIEDGMSRLMLPDDISDMGIEEINREMLLRAADREAVASSWKAAIEESSFYGTVRALDVIRIAAGHVPANRFLGLAVPGKKAKTLKLAADAVLRTLISMELIESPDVRVEVALSRTADEYRCAVIGASTREESVFAAAFYEMFVPNGRPRYVMVPAKGILRSLFGTNICFSCPGIIGTNKAQAVALAANMNPLGSYEAVYTGGVRGAEIYEAIRRSGTLPPSDSVRRLRMLL